MNEATDLIGEARPVEPNTVADLAGAANGRTRHGPDLEVLPFLVWMGPLEFRARYGDLPHRDHDFGTNWGTRGDQRVAHRQGIGTTGGMLYVHDHTWDEYAVLIANVSQATVARAFTNGYTGETRMSASGFAALVARQDAEATPEAHSVAGASEAPTGIGVNVGIEP